MSRIGSAAIVGGKAWNVKAGHFAERHGLIVIIALGESIVAIGVGAAGELSLGIGAAAVLGGDQSLLASGRLDNLASTWAAVDALIAADPTDAIAMIVSNDHEEVGSSSATGAAGPSTP